MKTFKLNTNSTFKYSNINLAIGNFDGIHLGHQTIIKKLISDSKKMKIKSAILSFEPHPRQYFEKNLNNHLIINHVTKETLFRDLGIDYNIIFSFDSSIASLGASSFVEKILVKMLKIKNITVGYDFKFGKNRKGNVDLLKRLSKKYDYSISFIDPVINPVTSEVYSSSLIRRYIQDAKFDNVSSLLGRHWSMSGTVIKGDQRASKINFPTANILPGNLIRPKKGVYAIRAKLVKKYFNGIANLGERPTVNGKSLLLEAHLFDFNNDIYGKELTVEFLTFIRDEKKFKNFDLLTEQIKRDIQLAKIIHLNK